VLAAMGLAGQWGSAVEPARDSLAPNHRPRRGRAAGRERDWGEDLFPDGDI
jgi:hypothetical protein